MERLKDKVAIVSGAADGMGEAIVKLFAAEGAQVLGVDLNAEKLKEAHGSGTNSIKLLDIDVTDDDADEKIIGETLSAFGAADILVNCAGVVEYENTEIMRDDNWERTLDVNLNAVFRLCRRVIPEMRKRGGGRIINIASINAYVVAPGLSAYAASKHAIAGLTKTMAVELAPFGIRVNVINPVAGETPLLKSFLGEDTPEMRGKFLSTIPLGRFSMPEDIASAALFLCSDSASMITGANLEVDGGRTI